MITIAMATMYKLFQQGLKLNLELTDDQLVAGEFGAKKFVLEVETDPGVVAKLTLNQPSQDLEDLVYDLLQEPPNIRYRSDEGICFEWLDEEQDVDERVEELKESGAEFVTKLV